MNAIDFVKEHGIEYAKGVVIGCNSGFLPNNENYTELKQIVDAFELVDICNGVENLKELLEEIGGDEWVYDLNTNIVVHADYVLCEDMCIRYELLKKAINLVEQCQ